MQALHPGRACCAANRPRRSSTWYRDGCSLYSRPGTACKEGGMQDCRPAATATRPHCTNDTVLPLWARRPGTVDAERLMHAWVTDRRFSLLVAWPWHGRLGVRYTHRNRLTESEPAFPLHPFSSPDESAYGSIGSSRGHRQRLYWQASVVTCLSWLRTRHSGHSVVPIWGQDPPPTPSSCRCSRRTECVQW